MERADSKGKVLLNYLPPATIYYPSPALSILKAFLQSKGIKTEIKYWNFLLNSVITKELKEEITDFHVKLIPFYAIMAEEYNDDETKKKLISYLQKKKPDLIRNGKDSYLIYYERIIRNVRKIISIELDKINFNEILLFGVSYQLLQLIPSIVLAKEVKIRSPKTPIVIGGIGTKEIAMEIMRTCPYFDFAIWGEGEYPLLELSGKFLNNNPDFEETSRLIYRKGDVLKGGNISGRKYLDFENYILPDYKEYYIQSKKIKEKGHIYYPINSIRSCHWRKCRFCNYNKGYKYRERSADSITEELTYLFKKYNANNFIFVDNDIIGTDIHRFEEILDKITDFKRDVNSKCSIWGEAIPHPAIKEKTIKKMAEAGLNEIFIGYEAVSDSILMKMHKSNDFAMNIFIVKSALKNNIEIRTNLIKGIPDETRDDIIESSANLHYLRFFFHRYEKKLSHIHGVFTLYKEAGYYNDIGPEEFHNYCTNTMPYYLPESFLNDKGMMFGYCRKTLKYLHEWWDFYEKEKYYMKNKFRYRFSKIQSRLYYHEYFNRKRIAKISINEKAEEVLRMLGDRIYSLDELFNCLSKKFPPVTKKQVQELIRWLGSLHLVYHNCEMTRIVSVVDI